MAIKTYRAESRDNYGHDEYEKATIEQINTGSFQRIADATEKMALNYDQLIRDRDMYKRWFNEKADENKMLKASLNTYKGVVTKLKKKLLPKDNN